MRDEQFERTIQVWADHEISSAPEMWPLAEMYRMVEGRRKSSLWSTLLSRHTALATAAASLMVLTVLCVRLYDPFKLFHSPSSPEMAYVRMREELPSQKGTVLFQTAVPSRAGQKGAVPFFAHLMFQFQKPESMAVTAVDIRSIQEQSIVLNPTDNYRLVMELARHSHIYAFQLTPSHALVRLFPNPAYQPAQNPLQSGQVYRLPTDPNWFYLAEGQGEARLYVVSSSQPLAEIERLYTEYEREEHQSAKQQIASALVQEIEATGDSHSNGSAMWAFSFSQR